MDVKSYGFDAKKAKDELVAWIKAWFNENGPECPAVIGISGGKDSSVVAGLCVEALGKDRVIGVMMPNGEQYDIKDSYDLAESLGIKTFEVNINQMVSSLMSRTTNVVDYCLSKGDYDSTQAKTNLPPRLRMATLYYVSQLVGGRVANTCNLSETMVGWETRWGDAVGDFAPLSKLTKNEVVAVGLELSDIPRHLVEKTPSDGLCGKTDEDGLGFTYDELDRLIRLNEKGENFDKIIKMAIKNNFKRLDLPCYRTGLTDYLNLRLVFESWADEDKKHFNN